MGHRSAPADREEFTLAEFERLPDEEGRSELVRGRLVREPPAGMEHGRLAARIAGLLGRIVRERELGEVFGAETGFLLSEEPPTVRAPDVAFVAADHLPPGELPAGFGRRAPDLAVEIVSPSDAAADVRAKVVDYLDAGTGAVWVVEPATRTVEVYRPGGKVLMLRGPDGIDGGELLPGLRVTVEELFGG